MNFVHEYIGVCSSKEQYVFSHMLAFKSFDWERKQDILRKQLGGDNKRHSKLHPNLQEISSMQSIVMLCKFYASL